MSAGLRRTRVQRAIIGVNLLGMVAALSTAWLLNAGEKVTSSINRVELSSALTPTEVDADGDLGAFNVLLVGYDSAANLDPDDPVAIGRQGEQLGDVIIIARIDEAAETATLLSVPRDLWVSIPGFEDNKINAAFQLGGPALLIDTIEAHLGIPINNYVSVDLAGFEGLVEVVDHVDLWFEHPARDFNPAPASGEPRSMTGFLIEATGCQPLGPEMALAFVRSRNFQIEVDGEWIDDGQQSDLERIRRQQLFLETFVARAIDLGARNPLVLRELITEAVPHVTLDQELTPQTLLDLGRAFDSFDADELDSFSLPTEFGFERNRTVSVVRLLDDEAAPILRLMEGVSSSDPSTVGLDLRVAADDDATASAAFESFEAAGFDVEPPVVGTGLPAGVTVGYGRDGTQAFELVIEHLGVLGVGVDGVVLDEALPGREVVVSFGGPVASPDGASSPPSTAPTADTATTDPPTTTSPAGAASTSERSVVVEPDADDDLPAVRSCP